MSSAYSTPINYGQTIPTTDLAQYVGAIQKGMQQKFDINLAKIDDLISKVATVPLARDKDKRYLGDKLQGLLSVVDANSKIDLTDNVVARQISSYITTAIDDNVREQLANSQKISNYQQTAAQRKKDKPELYNDANYTYGLDKSGYNSYMKGDTDSLGSMDYIDYYDVDKNLTKELESFAKERGFEKVLSSGIEGEYIYQTVKGKQLTEGEISSFFDNKIATDPKLKQQFMINSHFNYRGVSDEDIIKSYKEQSEPILKDFDTKIIDIDEKLKNVSADDKATADLLHRQKSEMQQQKIDFSSQLDPKNFNRDSFLYGNYTRNIKKSYINTYAYAAVTDINRDDFLLDIAKAKGETDKIPGSDGLAAGTRFRVEENKTAGEAPNYTDQFLKERGQSWNDLQAVIRAKLVEEGKQPTVANVTSYYTALKAATKEGLNLNAIKGYDTQVLDSYYKVVDVNKTAYQLTKIAKDNYGKATNEILTGLFGGVKKGLNRQGLEITAPHTAGLLKKYKNVDQIPPKDKAIALYELAINLRDEVLEDDSDKKKINFYIEDIKKQNKLSGTELKKYEIERPGFLEAGWDTISGLYGGALGAATMGIRSAISNSDGREYAKQSRESFAKGIKGLFNQARNIGRAFTSDTDLSEIEGNDIVLRNGMGVTDLMEDIKTNTISRFDEILQKSAKKEAQAYSIVLNPAIKKDENIVNAVNSAIVNQITIDSEGIASGGPPVKDSIIRIDNIKDGVASVTYTQEIDVPNASGKGTKKGESQTTVSIPLENLPKELTSNLETQMGNWAYSGKNRSGMTQTIAYSPPNNLDSKYDFTKNYIKNYGANLSQSDIAMAQTKGIEDVKTKEDYLKIADRILPPEYTKDFTDKYLNSKYTVEWERPENASAGFVGHLMQDGKRIKTVSAPELDYNQTNYTIYTIKMINEHLDTMIADYRSKALRLRN